MERVTVGIVGTGFSARFHLAALRMVHGVRVEVRAVAGRDQAKTEEFAAAEGIPRAFDDYRRVLADPAIGVVVVCVPNHLHLEIVLAAAEAGKHIVCEKPLTGAFGASAVHDAHRDYARVMADLERVASAVRAAGVCFMYAENWVYTPAMTTMKRLIEVAGAPILDIRAQQGHSGSHARAARRRATAGGGALLTLGAHPVGAALHLKQFEARSTGRSIRPASVTAEVARLYASRAVAGSDARGWLVSDWEDVETWANLVIGFDDGTRAVIDASFAMLGGVRESVEVYSTNAAYLGNMAPNDELRVYSPDPATFADVPLHEKVETTAGWNWAAPDADWSRGYPQEVQDFMESVALGREPESGLELACDVARVIYAGYLAADTGRRVELAVEERRASWEET